MKQLRIRDIVSPPGRKERPEGWSKFIVGMILGLVLGSQLRYNAGVPSQFFLARPFNSDMIYADNHTSHHVLHLTSNTASSDSAAVATAATHHWCIISQNYISSTAARYFEHFPHAAEALLPCWSRFYENSATHNCGFVIMDNLGAKIKNGSWHDQLIQAMGCRVEYRKEGYVWDTLLDLPDDGPQHVPNLLFQRPRYPYMRYLDNEEHAHALRRLFVNDSFIASVKDELDHEHHHFDVPRSKKPLQIGLLQRTAKRAITNLDEVRTALQNELPDAEIHMTTLESPRLRDQAEWFATKNVIIAAHGAALTNSIFITKGTIVLQAWPNKWFWQSLDPLIEQSGGIALDWYKTGVHPVVAFETAKLTGAQNVGRDSNFTVVVDEVVDRILMALEKKIPTVRTIEAIRDPLW